MSKFDSALEKTRQAEAERIAAEQAALNEAHERALGAFLLAYEETEGDLATKTTRLELATRIMRGEQLSGEPVAPVLPDEEQQLLEAYRAGRIKVTDKGAYRDTEWSTLHPKKDKAPASTPPKKAASVAPQDEQEREAASQAAEVAEPGKDPVTEVSVEPAKEAPVQDEPKAEPEKKAEEPKSFLDRALERGKQAVANMNN